MRSSPLLPVFLLIAALACGGPGEGSAGRSDAAADEWVTIDGVDFPAVMAQAPPEIVEAYVFAAQHPEVLSYMPCYCGCENEPSVHRSNYDCFVDAIDWTGSRPRVVIDPMGFT